MTDQHFWAVSVLPKQDPAAVLDWACRLYAFRHGAEPRSVRVAPALLDALGEQGLDVVSDDRIPRGGMYFPVKE